MAIWVVGCGGSDDGGSDDVSRVEGVAEPETSQAEPEPQLAPLEEPVEIDFGITLRNDRLLMVDGESNLPDGTSLRVVVEREASGGRWQDRTTQQEGRFSAGPFGPGSGYPDGGYRITVNLPEASVQPLAVQQRIGEEGEYLTGPLVGTSPHGLGQVASRSHRFLIGNEPRRTTDQVEVLSIDTTDQVEVLSID
ncbi:hypothetical protein [Halomonas sp.]|uniref:hypothetical protein n=1 Tax=Halomonas sp. TaxID=1486246 RepID=UPI00356625CD